MTTFDDDVLGPVTVRHNALSRSIKMKLSARGEVTVIAPKFTPLGLIKRAVKHARNELAEMRETSRPAPYRHGDAIGHSHSLAIVESSLEGSPRVNIKGRVVVVGIPSAADINNSEIQLLIREKVAVVLRKEAKAYLPKRLKTLAERYGYHYKSVRFPHATGRWGSCSSSGTISLNISLMKLPLDLIDYVILHELAHTKQMNHSSAFWDEVSKHNPHYKLHRRQIKHYSPII